MLTHAPTDHPRDDVPRWAERAARIAVLAPIPASLWRLPLIFGASMGMQVDFQDSMMAHPFWVRFTYLAGLGVVSDGLALLTLGLVRRWGEVWPRFLPLVGGRRVPPWFALALAVTGGLIATGLSWQIADGWNESIGPHMTWGWQTLMTACYAPMLLWGPLVLAVAWQYWRRRGLA